MTRILIFLPLFLLACGVSALPIAAENAQKPILATSQPFSTLAKPLSTLPSSTALPLLPVRGNWHIRTCPAYACPLVTDAPIAYSGEAFTVLCITNGWAMVGAERWINAGAFGVVDVEECE